MDNDDGTVTDNLTGLIWLKNAECTARMNWANALTYCNSLSTGSCGLTDGSVAGDWRLPNRKELLSLIDWSKNSPALPQGHPFSDVYSGDSYWTSTTYPDATHGAWVVSISSGSIAYSFKTNDFYIWPVRAPSNTTTVPTLSEWGMIIFFIILVGSALWVMRRRTKHE